LSANADRRPAVSKQIGLAIILGLGAVGQSTTMTTNPEPAAEARSARQFLLTTKLVAVIAEIVVT